MKRGRDDRYRGGGQRYGPPAPAPVRGPVPRILQLGDGAPLAVLSACAEDLAGDEGAAAGLVECALCFPNRDLMYAAVICLLEVQRPGTLQAVLSLCHRLLCKALQLGRYQKLSAVLRLLAALLAKGGLTSESFFQVLADLLNGAGQLQATGEAHPASTRDLRALCGDNIVFACLLGLLWGSEGYGEAEDAALDAFFAQVLGYIEGRKQAEGSGARMAQLRVPAGEAGAVSGVDDLELFAMSIKELAAKEFPPHPLLPAPVDGLEEALRDLQAQPVSRLADLAFGVPAEVGPVTYKYAAMRLLPAEHTDAKLGKVARFLVRATITDALENFSRFKQYVISTIAGMTQACECEGIVAEELFCHMLDLPRASSKVFTDVILMVELCKALPAFPRMMSGFARKLYSLIGDFDVELGGRLALWLAFHLSCFSFQWPWERWGWTDAAQQADGDAQQYFIQRCLSKAVLFSYYDGVAKQLPEGVLPMLPVRPSAEIPDNDDEDLVKYLLDCIRKKTAAEDIEVSVGAFKGGAEGEVQLKVLMTGILVAGSKSLTHLSTMLGRYGPLLDKYGYAPATGSDLAMDVVHSIWAKAPEEMVMAVDRLIRERFLVPAAVLAWLLRQPALREQGCPGLWSLGWFIIGHHLASGGDEGMGDEAAPAAAHVTPEVFGGAVEAVRAFGAPDWEKPWCRNFALQLFAMARHMGAAAIQSESWLELQRELERQLLDNLPEKRGGEGDAAMG